MCIRDSVFKVTVSEKLFKVDSNFSGKPPVHAELNFYTDGSKIDDRVGAGFVAFRGKNEIIAKNFSLPKICSVFQAEILAIREAAKFLTENRGFKYVRFFVDSQAALLALENRTVTSALVLETIQQLNTASKDRKITLIWVKAHIGTKGNELADKLAKMGTTEGCLLYTSPSPRD